MSFEAPTDASFSFGFACCAITYSFSKGEGPASAIPWSHGKNPGTLRPKCAILGMSKLWGKWTLTSFEDVQIMFVPLFKSRWRSFQEWGADMFWWIEAGSSSSDSAIQQAAQFVESPNLVVPISNSSWLQDPTCKKGVSTSSTPQKTLENCATTAVTNYDFSWLPTIDSTYFNTISVFIGSI